MSADLTPDEGAALLALARAAVEQRLFEDGAFQRVLEAITITRALAEPRACFVTLKTRGVDGTRRLRGCVGSTRPASPPTRPSSNRRWRRRSPTRDSLR